jgi:putative transposase
VRAAAAASGLAKARSRAISRRSVCNRRAKRFQLSTDTFFVEKVRDIVGLYLNPPDKALVLGVDEESQVRAPERTQPVLPMGLGYV